MMGNGLLGGEPSHTNGWLNDNDDDDDDDDSKFRIYVLSYVNNLCVINVSDSASIQCRLQALATRFTLSPKSLAATTPASVHSLHQPIQLCNCIYLFIPWDIFFFIRIYIYMAYLQPTLHLSILWGNSDSQSNFILICIFTFMHLLFFTILWKLGM